MRKQNIHSKGHFEPHTDGSCSSVAQTSLIGIASFPIMACTADKKAPYQGSA